MQSKFEQGSFSGHGKKIIILISVFSILFFVSIFALTLGASGFGLYHVSYVFASKLGLIPNQGQNFQLAEMIIWEVRLPRTLMSCLVGLALAVSGTLFQGCFRNPLVEPYILGVSGGAAFGAAMGIVFPSIFFSVSTGAFVFGFLAVGIAFSLAQIRGETSTLALILAGVIIGSFFGALVSILKYFSDDAALREIVFWLLGGFYHVTWQDVINLSPILLTIFGLVWAMGWKLNVLSMGDDEARTMGVNPFKYKFILIVAATTLTALSVSVAGIIAWVGLMTPHAARLILGPDHRFVLPLAGGLGAGYLLLCDTLARTMTGAEIPVGIITSIVGAPYLLYLLRTKTPIS